MKLELVCTDVNRFTIRSSSGEFRVRGTEAYAKKLMAEMQNVVDAMQNVTPVNRTAMIDGLLALY